MILHPGVLALLGGTAMVFGLVLYASALGLRILLRWDMGSSSAYQLSLERKTYLVSAVMNYAFAFLIASAFLFIYTADDIHGLFVGAMCATGTLNANPVGWNVIWSKIALFFLSGLWVTMNRLDHRAEDYPLVKAKYAFLLLILPLVGLDLYLQLRYFLGLDPDIITSCCGSLFSQGGTAVAGGLSSLPVGPAMAAFYGGSLLFLCLSVLCLVSERRLPRYLLSALSVLLFFVAIAAVVSFISVYIYELPTHHCPFDILQAGYGFIGYPIYLSMFGWAFFGVLPGVFEPMKKIRSLKGIISGAERRWLLLSIVFLACFLLLSSYRVVFGSFSLSAF